MHGLSRLIRPVVFQNKASGDSLQGLSHALVHDSAGGDRALSAIGLEAESTNNGEKNLTKIHFLEDFRIYVVISRRGGNDYWCALLTQQLRVALPGRRGTELRGAEAQVLRRTRFLSPAQYTKSLRVWLP